MSLEDFIEEHVVNADHDPYESDVDRVAREEDVAAAIAELKALREQVKTARLEGARQAWRIAYYWVSDAYGKRDAKKEYRKAFGEEAP